MIKLKDILTEAMSDAEIKKMHKKAKETGELPPHLKKILKGKKDFEKKFKVKNIVVPGLEWMADIDESVNEAIGSGATPAQIQKNISTALKGAGFKIKKFQKMSHGHGGIWGGFFTVDGGMVLPFHVKKDGKVSYDAGPKDWIIGNIDYVSVLRNELKKVKQMPDYGQSKLVKVKRTKKIAKEANTASIDGEELMNFLMKIS